MIDDTKNAMAAPVEMGGIAADRLRSIIERIEPWQRNASLTATTSRTSTPRRRAPASTWRWSAR